MTPADAPLVVQLGLSTKQLQVDSELAMYYSEEDIVRATRSDNEICITAEVDGKFVGFMLTHYNPVFKEAYISDIAIVPEYWGMGIGRLLSQKTQETLTERSVDWAWALVHEDNERMISFMEKQGFKKGRKFIFFYKPEYQK